MKSMIPVLLTLGVLGSYVAKAQDSSLVQGRLGYNGIEMALDQHRTWKPRVLAEGYLSIGPVEAGVKSLQEMPDFDKGKYFGRTALTLGEKNFNETAVAVLKTDSTGIIDAKYGLRTKSLIQRLGCFGFADVTFSKDAANFTTLIGKELGKGWKVELFQSTNMPYNQTATHYTEAQVYKQLFKGTGICPTISAFVRAEMSQFEIGKTGLYGGLAGEF